VIVVSRYRQCVIPLNFLTGDHSEHYTHLHSDPTIMSQDRVTQSNERLFKLYEKNLGQLGTKEFVETAIKLAAWLSNAKAYYTAARPNVCPLLGSFSCHFS